MPAHANSERGQLLRRHFLATGAALAFGGFASVFGEAGEAQEKVVFATKGVRGMDVRQVTQRTIEHIVVTSDRPYHEVQAALEAQMSILGNTEELVRQFIAAKLSWDQIKHAIEERMGQSGFTIFAKIEQGQLLAFTGKPIRACQYAIGNPLLAITMIEHVPEIALYAPLRIALYEDSLGKTVIARDNFSSLVAQYGRADIAQTAALVESKADALIAKAAGRA
jgi:uncharacterized protein (DUF302 family)